MDCRIEQWPAFSLAGFKHQVKTKQAFEVIPKIWTKAWRDGSMDRLLALFRQTDYRPAGLVGLVMGGDWGRAEDMEYCIGVTNHVAVDGCAHVPAPDGMEEIRVRAATWAIFEANGPLPEAVQSMYGKIRQEWLPGSGYATDDLPALECYMRGGRQEIWLAVVKE